jgi:hypothetical protein
MRTALIRITLLSALLPGISCSSEPEKDPITKKCETVCALDPSHPCAVQQADCITDCRSYGTKAQAFGGPACGECVAGTYVYAVSQDGTCPPTGFAHKGELSPECFSSCVKPDGGTGGL